MSTNDQNERIAFKNDRAMDNEAASDSSEGELSQDELNNVSGGRAMFKAEQPDGRVAFGPDGKAVAAQPSDDPSDALVR